MQKLLVSYRKHKALYLLCVPVMAFFLIFSYIPMAGLVMAFQNFKLTKGIFGSSFIGFDNFLKFFNSPYCWRVIRNTFIISGYDLLFSFPAPILLAFMLNEVKNQVYKRTVQTVTYMPYFISLVVICGLIKDFTSSDGILTQLVNAMGGNFSSLLAAPEAFRSIFIVSNIWQSIGFNSIIYLAALSTLDQELYEAARIDGAGHIRQWRHITVPGLMPTIVIMLILRIGQVMNVNFEKVILLYGTSTYETADVISSFVYRTGLLNGEYAYSTAVGLLNSIIGFVLIVAANSISKRFSETSLF